MTLPLVTDTPVVDPFSGINVSIPWAWGIVFVVAGFAALYLRAARHNAYDDRVAWNYGVGAIASAIVSGLALLLAVNQIVKSMALVPKIGFTAVIVILLIAWGSR